MIHRHPYLLWLFPVLLLACNPIASQQSHSISQSGDAHTTKVDSTLIRKAFSRADDYMDKGRYDSAQFWLNKIHEKVSYRKPSLFSYFLTVRQAEVYYYNNLHQLGLQEALRAVKIANTLQDDILKADAYNFCGLFSTNTGNIKDALAYLNRVSPSPGNHPTLLPI